MQRMSFNVSLRFLDTDQDGLPDFILESCTTTLTTDLDDDGDGWSDEDEITQPRPISRRVSRLIQIPMASATERIMTMMGTDTMILRTHFP